ncbi:zinc finger BED domain-containing protein 4-like [Hyperolius riggenbachi]|uniref:zinc finger BED domain-containing protein 4-like n=1 Tax=Hyperolius riggenbachi TaxID=752182 RepID=UPI0035A31D0B
MIVVFKRLQEQKGGGEGTRTIVQHSGGAAASSLPHGHRQGQTLNRTSSLSSAVSAAHSTDIEAGEASQSSFSSPPSTAHSSAGLRQTLLSDNFGRTSKPLPPRNWRIRKLNGLLAQAMCSQLLPYSLVNKGSAMRALLQFGIPEWEIPSRHCFARTAIPALHAFVVENVARSLNHAVTLVEVGENPASAGQLVVPPRALKGDAAGSWDSIPCTPRKKARLSSSIKPQQCQALLKLVSLGKEKLTGKYIPEILKEQEESWLTPRGLKVGYVASDNGSNRLAALCLGEQEHIPCLAHVLNLVVQRFLRTYPGMEELLETARKVVRHVRRSATASPTLANLQHDEGLPSHRLMIDLPTHWNSTMAMLQRLLQHREAVDKFIYNVNYKRTARSQSSSFNRLPVISDDQWTQIQQVCLVLLPFLQGTQMLEGEQLAALSTVEEEEDRDLQAVGVELEVPNLGNEGELQSAASVVRGWRLQEDSAQEEEVTNNVILEADDPNFSDKARLFPMAAHMLRCLRRDPRVIQMQEREDIWISLILDLRLKGKLGQFMAPSTTANRTKELQEALVRRLQEAFPQPSTTPTVAVLPSQQQVPASTTTTTSSSSSICLGDLLSLTKTLYAVELPKTEVPATESSANQEQRFSCMVSEYLGSFTGLDTNSPVDPMEYWVRRLSIWRELAQYALEVLACPPSSVLSERCFSAAGGVVTEKLVVSTDSVDKLTFLKINQAWVKGEFLAPPVGDRGK